MVKATPRIVFYPEEARLIRELLEAHRTNLEGHLAALRDMPDLAQVADTGAAEIQMQLHLVDSALELLGRDL